MASRKLTDVDRAEIVRLYIDGRQARRTIANRFGVSEPTIRLALQRAGVPLRSCREARGGLNDDQIRDAARLYVDERMGCPAIARRFGVNASTIQRALKRAGVPIRSPIEAKGGLDDEQTREAARLYVDERMGCPAIARRFAVKTSTIQKALKRAGVPRRSRIEARGGLDDEKTREAVRLYVDEMLSPAAIARLFGVNASNIQRALKRAGVLLRSHVEAMGGLDDDQTREAVRLYVDEGQGCPAIARRLGIGRTAIQNALKRAGVPIRSNIEAHGGLDDDQTREAERLYVDEMLPPAAIARRFGVGDVAILNALKREGVSLRTRSEAMGGLDDEQIRSAARLYADGRVSCPALSRRFGVAVPTIIRALKRAGVPIRTIREARGGLDDDQTREAARLYEDDRQTPTAIANRLGVSKSAVRNALKRAGVPLRSFHVDEPFAPARVYRIDAPDGRYYFGLTTLSIDDRAFRGWNDWIEDIMAEHEHVRPRIIAEGIPAYMAADIEARLIEAHLDDPMNLNRRGESPARYPNADVMDAKQKIHDDWLDSLDSAWALAA